MIDYYFYRVYMVFLKRKEFGRYTACIYFCELFLTALFFALIFTTHYLTGEFFLNLQSYWIYLIFLGVPVLFGIVLYRYYSKERIKKLEARYKDSRYNELLSDKLIMAVSHIELTIGLVVWFVIANS